MCDQLGGKLKHPRDPWKCISSKAIRKKLQFNFITGKFTVGFLQRQFDFNWQTYPLWKRVSEQSRSWNEPEYNFDNDDGEIVKDNHDGERAG